MKAAVYRRYGAPEVVVLADMPTPTPRAGEVLVAVRATGLTVGDARIRAARAPVGMGPMIRLAFGVFAPRRHVLGREYAGQVQAVGAGITRFQPGDTVFGITDGMSMGAHAEFVAVKGDGLIFAQPATLSAQQAAGFFFGGLTAADFLLDQCALRPGDRVLIVGATGAVGSAAVQIARHIGAHVTAMCGANNADFARDLGAHMVFDYAEGEPSGPFDVILDCPGVLQNALGLLAPNGRLGLVTASLGAMLGAMARPQRKEGKRILSGIIKETPFSANRLLGLHAAGAYRPHIGAVFALDDVSQAHALADSGHKRGNIVLTLAQTNTAFVIP